MKSGDSIRISCVNYRSLTFTSDRIFMNFHPRSRGPSYGGGHNYLVPFQCCKLKFSCHIILVLLMLVRWSTIERLTG